MCMYNTIQWIFVSTYVCHSTGVTDVSMFVETKILLYTISVSITFVYMYANCTHCVQMT